jgi:8-oxo-dGTP pyrophosphatase MutT (NUDIX family)
MIKLEIRDASSVIIVRKDGPTPSVLLGQRGKSAVFMPNKFVFPGGAVDQSDFDNSFLDEPDPVCSRRLQEYSNIENTHAFFSAAIREVWEETGLMFGKKCNGKIEKTNYTSWKAFYDLGLKPSATGFHFIFRAITPPNRSRRFDARFFLVNANNVSGEIDDFSKASDELSHLQWFSIKEARNLDLPFITEVILAEVEHLIEDLNCPNSVPFFNNSSEKSEFIRIT